MINFKRYGLVSFSVFSNLSKYSSGIYYLEVLTDKQRVFKKVLKY